MKKKENNLIEKIEIKNVSKKFKNECILENVNLILKSGNIYGFYGRNGSGKSVLLKMLSGLMQPTDGEIYYNNKKIGQDIYKLNIGAFIENPYFFSNLTGFDNLKLLAEIKNEITNKDIDDALKIVNLYSERNKKYSKYSLGMKQKLGIAQAIMENQNVIFLDEPFNGVDIESVNKIKEYLKKIKKDNKIIVISSHYIEDLKELSTQIYYFENGKVKG